MANTNKDTAPVEPTETDTVETAPEAETTPGTDETEDKPGRGRPTTRVAGGKQLSAYFEPDEVKWIEEAGFEKRHRKDSQLIRAAVLEYIKDVPKP